VLRGHSSGIPTGLAQAGEMTTIRRLAAILAADVHRDHRLRREIL
jgi:hypothetical protein